MSINILEAIQSRLTEDAVSKVAGSTGEAPSKARAAMSSGAFVAVAGLIRRGATKDGAAAILSHLEGSAPGGIGLLGEQTDDLPAMISQSSGVSHTAATLVLAALTPIAGGVLRKEVLSRGLDAAGLSSYLLSEKSSLVGHPSAPPGIAGMLSSAGGAEIIEERIRGGTRRDVSVVTSPQQRERAAPIVTPQLSTRRSTRKKTSWGAILGTLALAALLLAAFTYFTGRRAPVSMPEVPTAPSAEGTGQATITSGEMSKAALDTKSFKASFDFGSTTMTEGGEQSVKQLAEMLKAHPNARIRLEGHTDSVGEVSAPLSLERAEAVKQKLVAEGIDESRIETIGLRSKRPVTSSDTKEGRLENRRVEAVLLSE